MPRRFFAINLIIILLTACTSGVETTTTSTVIPVLTTVSISRTSPASIVLEQASIYTTQNNLTGNHLIGGMTDLPNANVLDIPIDGKPIWLVSAPFNNSSIFVAILENGRAEAFKISRRAYEPFNLSPNQLSAGMPPMLAVSEKDIQLIPLSQDASPYTSPLILENKLIFISMNGDLVSIDSTSESRLPVNALTDSRILVDETNRLLILTQPTNRYNHGILGDELEASAITLIETEPELRVAQTISVEAPDVIEGLSPIWADIDNNSLRDIIVTLSNNQNGSRIVAYREDGTTLAESAPIGLAHRWRHQIAVAGFDADKPPLLVDIRTPHIGA